MITNHLNSKSATAYAPALLAKRVEAAGNGVSTTVSGRRAFDLAATAHGNDKSAVARQLTDSQRKLAGELTDGVKAANQNFSGPVTFSLDAKGTLSVDGPAADKAMVNQYLANDTSSPRLQDRLSSMLQGAQALGAASLSGHGTTTPTDPVSPAPYSSGPGSSPPLPAAITVSSTGSSLAYAGSLDVDA